MCSILISQTSNYANNLIRQFSNALCAMSSSKYEVAVDYINSLQSNAAYIQSKNALKHTSTHSTTIAQTQKYLQRTGITLEELDKLPVIHVSGTKGKGSTCAFCESILRQHGYKTGLYTSPHLVAIRERIKINGKAINEDVFAEDVISIYNKLFEQREKENDMPLYFRFLTILAFNIFIQEKVDVAIIEVGIGGEFDCTNILRKTQVVGIASLGMDHTQMLGDNIEAIAWQKSGIMKPQVDAFTVPQPSSALNVIQKRAFEKQCNIKLVPVFEDYKWNSDDIPTFSDNVQKINASLAIQLAHTWISKFGKPNNQMNVDPLFIPEETRIGIKSCKWPGRFQILKLTNATVFLDGAHTEESLEKCADWFIHSSSSACKVLIFNLIGKRDAQKLLHILNAINFTYVIFVPNNAYSDKIVKGFSDQENVANNSTMQLNRCEQHRQIWNELERPDNDNQQVSVLSSVSEALSSLPKDSSPDVLVTGSLHLVGAALTILDPNYQTF